MLHYILWNENGKVYKKCQSMQERSRLCKVTFSWFSPANYICKIKTWCKKTIASWWLFYIKPHLKEKDKNKQFQNYLCSPFPPANGEDLGEGWAPALAPSQPPRSLPFGGTHDAAPLLLVLSCCVIIQAQCHLLQITIHWQPLDWSRFHRKY